MAAVAALPKGTVVGRNYGNLGYRIGTIELPHADGMIWSTPVTIGPGTNLVGQGKFSSIFACTYAGDCLTIDHSHCAVGGKCSPSTTNPQFQHSVFSNSKIENFSIHGDGKAGQNILHFKDVQGLEVHNVVGDGASEPGGACFWLEDINWWTERNTFTDDSSGYNCNIGWRFTSQSSKYDHPSFGYNRFLDIKFNTAGAQTAFSLENNSFLYSGTYRITGNKGDADSIVWYMSGGAEFYENELQLQGEENGSGGYFLDITSPRNAFSYWGNIIWGGGTANYIVPGATVIHWLDSNYFTAVGNFAQNSVNWAVADTLPKGFDLNAAKSCGNYEVTSPRNGPRVSPPNALLHVQVICAGNAGPGYIEQIVYLANYTDTSPVVFERNEDGGKWGAWYEVYNGAAGLAGHATCWKASGKMGYCSSAIDSTGVCTCN